MGEQNITPSIETIGSWEESPECECPEPGSPLRLQTCCMTVGDSCSRRFQRGKGFRCDFTVSETVMAGGRFRSSGPKRKLGSESGKGRRKGHAWRRGEYSFKQPCSSVLHSICSSMVSPPSVS